MEKTITKHTSWIFTGIILLLSIALLLPPHSQAQTDRYWIGGYSDLWGDADNWNDPGGNTGVPVRITVIRMMFY